VGNVIGREVAVVRRADIMARQVVVAGGRLHHRRSVGGN